MLTTLLSLLSALGCLVLLKQVSIVRRRKYLPPGPPGHPLLGNTFSWPSIQPWNIFAEWAKIYGDLVYGKVGPNDILVINSYPVAVSLLQGKSAQYSDRATQHFLGNMVGWASGISMLPDGAEHRNQRRMFQEVIGTLKSFETFEARISKWVGKFVSKLAESSEPNVPALTRWLAGVVILDVTYGYKISDKGEDPLLELARQVLADFSAGVAPGAHLVDTFPWLERLPSWMPGTSKKVAKIMRERWMRFVHQPFATSKSQLLMEDMVPCFITAHFSKKDLSPAEERSLMWSAANMYAGGTDTTAAVLSSFVLFMVQYPHVQARAQTEVDALLGGTRLPTTRDIDALPYVRAVINEVLRFGLVIPQGVPHCVQEEDNYEGYVIPKGTIVLPNAYFMSRDPRNYKDPELFNPDRFLGENPELDPRKYVFGFGRRACPGRVFAEMNLFMSVVTCLLAVTFLKAKDQEGKEIEPKIKWEGTMVTHLERFPCRVVYRSEQAKALVQNPESE